MTLHAAGGTVTILPRFEPGAVLRSIGDNRSTFAGGMPVMLNALVNYPDAGTYELAVYEAGVVGVSCAELGQRVRAYVALKPGAQATDRDLMDWAAGKIAATRSPGASCSSPLCPRGRQVRFSERPFVTTRPTSKARRETHPDRQLLARAATAPIGFSTARESASWFGSYSCGTCPLDRTATRLLLRGRD